MTVEGDGLWLYAILGDDSADDRLAGLRGVADEPVRTVTAEDLAAAVGTVNLHEFGQDALRRNLEDLDWVAAKARAHDAVITAIARSGPVIPVRMATVYVDNRRVEQLLKSRHGDFNHALRRVAGREELGVKAYADPKGLAAQDDPVDGNSRSGTAYLLRRRRELASQEEAFRVASQEADRIHTALMRHAVDGKRKPATDRALSGRDEWTVLNGTYLVDEDVVESIPGDRCRPRLGQRRRITLEITGPWPPYSFAGDLVAQ